MPPIKKQSQDIGIVSKVDKSNIGVAALAYVEINNQISKQNKTKNSLRTKIAEYFDKAQDEHTVDAYDNKHLEVSHAGVKVRMSETKNTSVVLKGDAIHKVKRLKRFAHVREALIKTHEYFDEAELERLVAEGTLTDEDVECLVEYWETPVFTIKKVK